MSELADIQRSLGTVQGTLSTLVQQITEKNRIDETRHSMLEKRVSGVENKQSWFAGLSAFCGVVIGFLIHRVPNG